MMEEQRSQFKGLLYCLPALLIIAVFTVYPLIRVFMMSGYVGYDLASGKVGAIGLDNYKTLLDDEIFHKAMKNTFVYVILVVPATVCLSLLLATVLNSKIRFRIFFQTLYFLPYVTSVVAMGIVWGWIFHSQYGLFNFFLGLLRIPPVQWLNTPETAMVSLIIFSVWKGLSFNIVIFLAGMQSINPQYYEAASVDGTPKMRVFLRITMPLLSPMIAFAFVIEMISSFKVYTEIYSLFGGKAGPANSAISVVYYIFDKFYNNWQFGIASAAAVVLFFIILVFTLIQQRVVKKRLFY